MVLQHMGALAYAMERGLSCPVYCTVPAKTMGHLAMYDAYLSKHHSGNFSLFTPDSIDAAWERVVPLKFSQHVVLEPSRPGAAVAAGVEITPYLAGHTLGGAFWRIKVLKRERKDKLCERGLLSVFFPPPPHLGRHGRNYLLLAVQLCERAAFGQGSNGILAASDAADLWQLERSDGSHG
jgi:hypothetical protein